MSFNSDLLDRYVECYNARDLDGVIDLYAEDALQIMPDGRFEGKDAIRKRLAMELDACSDVVHSVRSFVEQGEAFCDEWTFQGTHTGALTLPDGSVVEASGQPVEVAGMEICRVNAEGKLILNALYYDNLALAVQVGLIPQTTTA
jgi:predicted ester cyclase